MALSRRVLLMVASGSLIYSGLVSALGMGDITLHSALNQPLSAEIELLDVADLSADDIRVALASSNDFARVGVERLAFLQDLSFTPVIDGTRSRIRVASNKSVNEPYLNFLVEITRAKSRMLREYTVLLDPLPTTPAPDNEVVSVPQAVASPVRAEPANFSELAELPQASLGKRHRVASGESLWMIANAYVADGAQGSQSQFMRDIQALNPNAFPDGDPGRLKAGANLLLPDSAEGAATTLAEPVSAQPMAESIAQNHPIASSEPADASALDDQITALRRQLFEELAASREENQQLRQTLADLQMELEAVTGQLVEQQRPQATASPQLEQSIAPVDTPEQPVAEPSAAQMAIAEPAFGWQDWTLAGGGVLVALLLGGLWFGRRHKRHVEFPVAVPVSVVPPTPTAPVAPTVALEMPRQPAHASVSETDVLEAAEIYLSYGRRDEALEVLQRGIERAPEQLDIRLRHLGLLVESGDIDRCRAAANAYLQAGGSQAQLDPLLTVCPALAATFASANHESSLDPDVTFVLNEFSPSPLVGLAPMVAEPRLAESREQIASEDSQPWLDGIDESALTLGDLPSLFDNSCSFASISATEELRQLEANPEHLVRLNQAAAYIKQGDMESACVILESLAIEGDEKQRQQVNELLAQIA